MTEILWKPVSTSFPDGAVWTRTSPTTITYEGPAGPSQWEWSSAVECSAAWLAVCTH